MFSITSTCICANIHPEEFSVIPAMVMPSTCALESILFYPLDPIILAIFSFPKIIFFPILLDSSHPLISPILKAKFSQFWDLMQKLNINFHLFGSLATLNIIVFFLFLEACLSLGL